MMGVQQRPEDPYPPGHGDALLWCLGAAAVATFLGGYVFGEGNQLEHLLLIERARDAEFLAGDAFLEASERSNPRFYYVQLMAWLSRWLPLPVLFLLCTVVGNALVAGASWRATRLWFPRARLAPYWSVSLVLGVHAFSAGAASHVPRGFVEPALLARGFALFGLLALWRRHPVRSALAFGAAIALHPLVGVETFLLAAAAHALGTFGLADIHADDERTATRAGDARIVAALGLVLATVAAALWAWQYESTLGTTEFFHILTRARAPHHYLPSTWSIAVHVAFALFVLATLVAVHDSRRASWLGRAVAARHLALVGGVVCACIAGWIFVEVWPVRAMIAAQWFRMTYLVKWIGLIVAAACAERYLRAGPRAPIAGAMLLAAHGRFQPLAMLLGCGIGACRSAGSVRRLVGALPLLAVPFLVSPANLRPAEPLVAYTLLGLGTLAWRARSPTTAWPSRLAVLATVATLIGVTVYAPSVVDRLGAAPPRFQLEYTHPDLVPVARWAEQRTAPTTTFVVPPNLGAFRLLARRPVVVDFKVFPFGDRGMREWFERMRACCGEFDMSPDHPASEAIEGFRSLSGVALRELGRRYAATHALLRVEHEVDLPTLYEDERFRIVELVR